MFSRLLKLPDDVRRRYDLASLEIAIHAAAPCPIQVKEQMIDWWWPIIHEYYGSTEGSGSRPATVLEWLAHKGTVGRNLFGELHILDDDKNPAGREQASACSSVVRLRLAAGRPKNSFLPKQNSDTQY